MTMKPFADDSGTTSIGNLSVENGSTCVVLSGSVEITRDKAGLKHAQALKALVDALVKELEAADDLPARIESASREGGTHDVANPFA